MEKSIYVSPVICLIDMKSYGIMDIQGESRFRVDSEEDVKIIEGDPETIDAKQYHLDLWADEEPIADVFDE